MMALQNSRSEFCSDYVITGVHVIHLLLIKLLFSNYGAICNTAHLNPVCVEYTTVCVHIVSQYIPTLVMVHNNSILVHILLYSHYTHNTAASVPMLGWCHLQLLDG